MTFTATPIFTSEGVTQFELDPLLVINGHPIRYVIALTVTAGGARISRQAETLVYAADADGCGDATFFLKHGYIAAHFGDVDIPRAISALGYEVVPALRLVSQ